MTSSVGAGRPVRILEGQGASERADQMIATYFTELESRLPQGFDPEVLTSASPADLTPPRGDFLLLSEIGSSTILGFGGVHLVEETTGRTEIADLQRMWLVPDARGRGLGHLLLRSLENRARALGARRIRLSLNHELTEAMALYHSAGYTDVAPFERNPYVDVFLGKDL